MASLLHFGPSEEPSNFRQLILSPSTRLFSFLFLLALFSTSSWRSTLVPTKSVGSQFGHTCLSSWNGIPSWLNSSCSSSSLRSDRSSSPLPWIFGAAAAAGRASARVKRCLYEVLEVSRNADGETIKKSYRRLSMKYHPDRNTAADADENFKEIASAYEVLSDPTKRRVYDKHGMEGLEQMTAEGGMHEAHDPLDLFSQFFNPGGSNNRRGGRREKAKAPSTVFKLRVSLDQLFFGELLHVSYTRSVLCVHAEECFKKRPDCQGASLRVVTQQMGPGFIVQNQIQDDSCVEKGKAWDSNCSACPKGRTNPEVTVLTAYVEKGMSTGEKISFDSVGEQKIGYESGDVIFVIDCLKHPRFTRDANDLRAEMKIDLLDALVGFKRPFRHIDGKDILVEKTGVTYDGEVLLLPKRGMPVHHRSGRGSDGSFGDLSITFKVVYPTALSEKQKTLVREALGGGASNQTTAASVS